MIKSITVPLNPTVKQINIMYHLANLSRGIYNNYVELYYKNLDGELDEIMDDLGLEKYYNEKLGKEVVYFGKRNIRKIQQAFCRKSSEYSGKNQAKLL